MNQATSSLPQQPTWSLKEIDEQLGLVKGKAFIAFKRTRAELVEGQDFFYYNGLEEPELVEALKQSKRVYASSVNAVLFAETAYQKIVTYLRNNA